MTLKITLDKDEVSDAIQQFLDEKGITIDVSHLDWVFENDMLIIETQR